MSFKNTALKIGLAASLLSSAQGIDASEKPFESTPYPKMVAAHFHKEIDRITIPEHCASPKIDINYDREDGEQRLKKITDQPTSLKGTLTRINIRCADASKNMHIGDTTMPVSSSEHIEIHQASRTIAEMEQKSLTYSLVGFPGVSVQIDKHHGLIPYQKLTSLEQALESIKALGLHNPLQKVSIRKLDVMNAFAEEGGSHQDAPDEIILSEQMLEEFSQDELAIILRHEMYHLILENSVNPLLDSVKDAIIDAIKNLSPEQKKVFSRSVNESHFYSSIFSKAHQAEPKDEDELPVMFFNTRNSELPSLTDSPEAYKKAALELIEQLSIPTRR